MKNALRRDTAHPYPNISNSSARSCKTQNSALLVLDFVYLVQFWSSYIQFSGALQYFFVALWRNWQTHWTQNPAEFTLHFGSTPKSATNLGTEFNLFIHFLLTSFNWNAVGVK
jgi:hypothetical protein